MSPYDKNIFELQPLEIRRLLTTAAIDAGGILHVVGTGNAETITLNQLSNGRVSITGVGTTFLPGSQFTQILIEAGGGNDTVSILNNVTYTTSTITGNAGNDSMTGGKSTDYLYGAAGNDNLDGGVGNDWLDGNAGNDLMVGGDGKDTSNYSDRATAIRVTLDGAANDGETSVAEADNVQTEEVLGGAGNDSLTGSNSASDYLSGNGGTDNLTGQGGNDELTGGAGSDNMQAGEGDDYLHAQNNDRDTVNGGTGPGATDHDLAEIDGLDVSGLNAGLIADGPLNQLVNPNPADLDGTYGGGDGKVSDENLNFEPNATAVDSQGRVIFVGSVYENIPGLGYGNDMAVVRYNADGSRDTTFAGNGEAIIDYSDLSGSGYNDDDVAYGVVIGSDDSIFVVGYTSEPFSSRDSAVAKLNSGGNRDSLWGSNGRAVVDASGDGFSDDAYAGVQQTDGKLVVVGEAGSEGTSPRLFRLRANGALDVSDSLNAGFGGDGVITDINMDHAGGAGLQNLTGDLGAQRIVVAGQATSGEFVLQRFLPDGSLDTVFGSGGTATQDFGGTPFTTSVNGLVIEPTTNNIIVAGSISNFETMLTNGVTPPASETTEAVLAKYNASGAPIDAASHVSESGYAQFRAVTIDEAGRYVVVGVDGDDFLVCRLTSAMQPDTGFGTNGVTITDFTPDVEGPDYQDSALATRVVGGKILAAGTSFHFIPDSEGSVTVPAIARYRGGNINNTPPNNEQDVTEVEDFSNYGELHQQPPTPRMQAIFDRITSVAKNNLLWQPDDKGIVRVELDDRNNTVKFGTITAGDGKLNVTMTVDGIQTLYYDPTTTKGIEIYAKGGNDLIQASNAITIPLLVDAGAGNDIVVAGAGNDIIFGGTGIDLVNGNNGNDVVNGGADSDGLYGDGGRDIVIGGAGADAMAGGADDDIEIGGTTSYDADNAANVLSLKALIAEWGSATPNAQRVIHIRTGVGGLNGSNVLRGIAAGAGATVFNDNVIDIMTNDPGRDWFFARTTGSNAVKDQILGGVGSDELDLV